MSKSIFQADTTFQFSLDRLRVVKFEVVKFEVVKFEVVKFGVVKFGVIKFGERFISCT